MAGDAKGKSSLVSTIVVALLLTLIGAGTGFAVGAMLGVPPQTGDVKMAEDAPTGSEGHGAASEKKTEDSKTKDAANAHGEGEAEVIAAFETPPPVTEDEAATIVPLQPIITNLAAPKDVWLRVEASILVHGGEGHGPPGNLADEVGASLLAYLRTLSLQDIEGPTAFLAFRDDLDDLVRTLSHGAVAKVLIKSLVVE